MAPLGFFKNIKEFGKKVAQKAGAFLNKAGKVVEGIKKVVPVDKILENVPYGDTINKVIDTGVKVANTAGQFLTKVGNNHERKINQEPNIEDNPYIKNYAEESRSRSTSRRRNRFAGINESSEFAIRRTQNDYDVNQPSFLSNRLN